MHPQVSTHAILSDSGMSVSGSQPNLPSQPAILSDSGRPQTSEEWLAPTHRAEDGLSNVDEMDSLVGGPPRELTPADMLPWMRATLSMIGYPEHSFNTLVDQMGLHAAGEVVLLMLTRRLRSSPHEWPHALQLGIPDSPKSWRGITALQRSYNDAVANRCLHVPSPGQRPQRSFR